MSTDQKPSPKRVPGGGRKPISTEGYAVRMYLTFPPDVAAFLRSQPNASAYLTQLVRREIEKNNA